MKQITADFDILDAREIRDVTQNSAMLLEVSVALRNITYNQSKCIPMQTTNVIIRSLHISNMEQNLLPAHLLQRILRIRSEQQEREG